MIENQRKIINECPSKVATTPHADDSSLDMVMCDDKKEYVRKDRQGFSFCTHTDAKPTLKILLVF